MKNEPPKDFWDEAIELGGVPGQSRDLSPRMTRDGSRFDPINSPMPMMSSFVHVFCLSRITLACTARSRREPSHRADTIDAHAIPIPIVPKGAMNFSFLLLITAVVLSNRYCNRCGNECGTHKIKQIMGITGSKVLPRKGMVSFYSLAATKGDGSTVSMADFKGKVVYATNVASK